MPNEFEKKAVGQELLNVPFPQMVLRLGMAITEAQTVLDRNSIEMLKELAANMIEVPIRIKEGAPKADGTVPVTVEKAKMTLLQFGIMPTFYQFSESTIEVKMAITMAESTEAKVGVKNKLQCWSASVNAKYSQKYSYKVEGSSLLRTKLLPVPPPPRVIPEVIPYTEEGTSGGGT